MIAIGSGSPITVSVPIDTREEPLADYLHALFPNARVCVVARQQPRCALGDTGTNSRADVVQAIEAITGAKPDGASIAAPRTLTHMAPGGSTSPEVIRIAALLGATVHDASDYVALPREECLSLLSELADDATLQAIVGVTL